MSAQVQGRLSGWWAAWQYVVILLLLLGASIALNIWQLKRAITAPLRAENKALQEAQRIALELTNEGQARERKLLSAADMTAGTLQQAGDAYRQATADRPLAPQCAPGPARVDAVNKALGSPSAGNGEDHGK